MTRRSLHASRKAIASSIVGGSWAVIWRDATAVRDVNGEAAMR
jgi:hypothetical protein